MSLGILIGLAAADVSIGALEAGFAIKDSKRAQRLEIQSLKREIAATKHLFDRRVSERIVEIAGVKASVITATGGNIEGYSVNLAILQAVESANRSIIDDAFVTANRIDTLHTEIRMAKLRGRRQRLNAALGIIGDAVSSGMQLERSIAASNALSDSG